VTYNSCINDEDEGVPALTQCLGLIIFPHHVNYKRQDSHPYYEKAVARKQADEVNEYLVIPPADTSAKPNAMMIEVYHTIIANVAVANSLWAEDHA